jgi:ribonuclease HI
MSAVDFIQDIPADKKYLLELKFNIFLSCKSQQYAAVIVDNKHKKTIIKQAIEETILQRVELLAILDVLQHMLEKFDEKTKSYLCVTLYTDSIYCGNILNEWLTKWQPTNFANRPNADLLMRLVELVTAYGENLSIHYSPPNSLEYLALSRKEIGL